MRATPTISGAKHVPQLYVCQERGDEWVELANGYVHLALPYYYHKFLLIETLDYLGSGMRAHQISQTYDDNENGCG